MSEQTISEQLNGILPFLSPGANTAYYIGSAHSSISALIKEVENLDEENLIPKNRIHELEGS